MNVERGDVVLVGRNGLVVLVTDAADPGEPVGEYQTIDRVAYMEMGQERVTSSMPAESIFVGRPCSNIGSEDYYFTSEHNVVSDMSEVRSVLAKGVPLPS